METDYSRYGDDMLLEVANMQAGANLSIVNLNDLHAEKFAFAPPTWLQTILVDFVVQGFGQSFGSKANRDFLINEAGLRRARQIRTAREGRAPVRLLKTFTRSDWIALAALLVSLISALNR